MTFVFETVYKDLVARFGAVMSMQAAACCLGYSTVGAAYHAEQRGNFPVPVRRVGTRLLISTADVALFLACPEHSAKEALQGKRRVGRPTKVEQIARERGKLSSFVRSSSSTDH